MNKVMLIGNVGREPEVRYVDQGVAVARLSLATTERGYTLPNGTKVPDRTDWHNVVLWRRLAEIVEKYVHKGDKLYIEGRLRYSVYDDKQGKRHSITEVWADNMEMLTPKTLQMSQDVESSGNTSVQSATGKSMEPENDLPF
ncbi:single-stranded DNA-binding protein [Bacteroides caecimuris]|jgi:single-strand DNA-binding protein|uniref:single-stranded DNA-binding protein n=1 Tax=Bacteroides caecimuris TaxID=1796613 RepID=UPI002657CCB8|nr:single-stranded DNA-binding protein [Bacteroides caecimuris]